MHKDYRPETHIVVTTRTSEKWGKGIRLYNKNLKPQRKNPDENLCAMTWSET
jgi:hypothetical protein